MPYKPYRLISCFLEYWSYGLHHLKCHTRFDVCIIETRGLKCLIVKNSLRKAVATEWFLTNRKVPCLSNCIFKSGKYTHSHYTHELQLPGKYLFSTSISIFNIFFFFFLFFLRLCSVEWSSSRRDIQMLISSWPSHCVTFITGYNKTLWHHPCPHSYLKFLQKLQIQNFITLLFFPFFSTLFFIFYLFFLNFFF